MQRTVLSATALALLVLAGCNPATRTSNAVTDKSPDAHTAHPAPSEGNASTGPSDAHSAHEHKPGAHGGIMVSLGRDSYHVEAIVDSEGSIRLYTLGKDETSVIDVESQTLNGFVKAEGETGSKSIVLEPSPQDGDAENKSSLFIGKLPSELVGRKLDVTIPNIRIGGERFRLGFQTGNQSHGDSVEMPAKIAEGEESQLYLTPGGRYTAADIAANGNVTASQKFKGIKSDHNMSPMPGDRICPISGTKANPNFTWTIDGKAYQFCCPPCVEEFLRSAKASDEPLPAPDSYVK